MACFAPKLLVLLRCKTKWEFSKFLLNIKRWISFSTVTLLYKFVCVIRTSVLDCWHSIDAVPTRQWRCLDIPVTLRRHGSDTAPTRQWRCADTAVTLRRHGSDAAPTRQWCCADTAVMLRRHGSDAAPTRQLRCADTAVMLLSIAFAMLTGSLSNLFLSCT